MPAAIVAAVVLFAFACSSIAAIAIPLPDSSNDFNSPGFVVRHAWVKFAFLAARPFRDQLTEAEKDQRIARYFELNGLIEQRERVAGDPESSPQDVEAARSDLERFRDERASLKNTVQVILEGRLTHVIKEEGLTRRLGGDIVWPPVNIEFESPPSVLVKSPRSEIRIQSESLLEGDLPIERAQQLEANAERDGKTSALVVEIGGIAMYPAIIPPSSDYEGTLQDIAHEWTHHYLFFAPLGRRYYDSGKLTTLNETLADKVGSELGDRMFAEYPLQQRTATAAPRSPDSSKALGAGIDFVAEMRGLRRDVEALLADGKIDDAESLMEQKREFLAANGYYIRKLNQAYFAFHGSYANSAGSIDPIGPKFDQLRDESASLRDFVRTAQQFESEGDLDAALSAHQPA